MKTIQSIPTRHLPLNTTLRPLAVLLAALCFQGCASTGGPRVRTADPAQPWVAASQRHANPEPQAELKVAFFRWTF